MTAILSFSLVGVSFVAIFFIYEHFKDVRAHKAITAENAELIGTFDKLRGEVQQSTEKFNQTVAKYNSDSERWKDQHNSALQQWKEQHNSAMEKWRERYNSDLTLCKEKCDSALLQWKEKYNRDHAKWQNACEELQKQNLTLEKWKEFLKPEKEAEKLVEQASKMVWEAELQAKQIIAAAESKIEDKKREVERLKLEAENALQKAQQRIHQMMIDAEIKAQERDREAELSVHNILLEAEQKVKAKEREAEKIINSAIHDANQRVIKSNQKLEEIQNQIIDRENSLIRIQADIDESYKIYKYRKTLPASHDKLKDRYETLKEKLDSLKEELKEAKASGKTSAMSSKEKEKFLAQFDRLAKTYIEDNFKFVMSKMTTNNYTTSRDRVLKAIQICRSIDFDFPETMEEEYTEKIREEFKRVLRIEEMRIEQQRIKEQIREEQKALRELKKLEEKEQQAIKERQAAEETRAAMQRAIEEALANAQGEHTAQIQEMEKALQEKDVEIAAKQQEIEDNQRAISNAQITKAGHVYVLSNIGSFGEGVFKIGMTRRNDPQDRVNELGDASVPFPFDVHLMVGCNNAPDLEKSLHKRFNNLRINRINLRKEYFRVNVDDVRSEIQSFLGKDVDYVADPHVMEEYAEQYRLSQTATLEDIEEVEGLYKDAGIDLDGDENGG